NIPPEIIIRESIVTIRHSVCTFAHRKRKSKLKMDKQKKQQSSAENLMDVNFDSCFERYTVRVKRKRGI
ncbi:MAG: hypothetical protein PUA95_02060, partial [Lactimicrobium massiliense]